MCGSGVKALKVESSAFEAEGEEEPGQHAGMWSEGR